MNDLYSKIIAMNLKVPATIFVSFLLFFSCASHTGGDSSSGITLKSTAAKLDASTNWTATIEEDLLSRTYREINGISGKIDVSIDFLPAAKPFYEGKKIFPRIIEAYSLDTDSMPEKCYSLLDNFLKAFEKGEGLETYVEGGSVYSLVMFKYDFDRLYGNSKVLWHAIGEPFCGEGFFQCPVRLFFESEKNYDGEHADAMIFVRDGESEFKIVSVDLINSAGE